MLLISHSDSSLPGPGRTQVTNWVMKAVVSADVDVKLRTGNL